MNRKVLKIGRIDYLNVWPLFALLEKDFPPGSSVSYTSGHPAELNRALAQGDLDLSPSSSMEYLVDAENYQLLPGLTINSHGPVQSVLFLTPVDPGDLGRYMAEHGNAVYLSGASATSAALLKVLWRFAWDLPEPEWRTVGPGQGLDTGRPHLEIGNVALRRYLHPPEGWRVVDLGGVWKKMTGLPFVFAVWILRRDPDPGVRQTLTRVNRALEDIKQRLDVKLPGLIAGYDYPEWLTARDLTRYFEVVRYDFGPREKAGLALFGDYCRRLGLLSGVPALSFFD